MGIKCAEDPFNMGMFFAIRCPSLSVHFQTPNTHIRAFHTGVAPPGCGLTGACGLRPVGWGWAGDVSGVKVDQRGWIICACPGLIRRPPDQ